MRVLLSSLALAVSMAGAAAQVPAAGRMEQGEIRRIDADKGKVTLKHGELKSVDMPAMTMAFAVRDPKQLAAVKVGDKVRFTVVKQPDGSLVVTDIAPAK